MGIRNSQKHKETIIQKVMILTLFTFALGLFGFSANTYASDDRFELIKTVYHVYVDGEEIGIVDEKSVVEDTKKQMINKAEDRFKDIQLTVNEDIQYVPERIFNPEINNKAMKEKLADKLTIGVMGVKVSFDGKTLGHFKTKEEAEKIIEELKLQHISEDTLNSLKKQAVTNTSDIKTISLSTKEKEEDKQEKDQIKSVSFDKRVDITATKVTIDELIDQEKALSIFKKGILKTKVHEVKEDESAEEVAEQYDLTMDEFYELNPGLKKKENLKEGQKVYVTEYAPFAKVIVKENVTKEHTIEHKSEVKKDDKMPKGDSKIEQSGKDGKKRVQYEVTKVNGKVAEEKVLSEEILSEPVTEIKLEGTKIIPSRGTGSFHWPTVGGYISSKKGQRWGRSHKGIDIARPSSRSILAVDNGTVSSAGFNSGGYGNRIIINHNNGFKSVYAHLASMNVKVGQTVKKGQKIGVMGSTGNSTGVHLHFELYKNGSLLNPLKYISQ
ncbi:peptidoglycan DD-metalloendopeptidase family protein [Pseudalkalibacillus berkeleyi]|uniref:M23 family metallopeptidase n=1 Tax=Pseudalkalibacillus berkeleyi TaxID=1069813 RepID=A0ABS9H559_9BACL|nr:M23 family metallopeptidase [Pseudalkalibacillus berkeleyi]MCF6139095.1 M23 family metallopeptidase [Pseudalkalibacillus berkeleyi]